MYKSKNRHAHSDYDLADDIAKIRGAISHAAKDVRGKANEVFAQSVENVKGKSADLQDDVANYVSEKPFKSLGLTLLAGLCIGFLLGKK